MWPCANWFVSHLVLHTDVISGPQTLFLIFREIISSHMHGEEGFFTHFCALLGKTPLECLLVILGCFFDNTHHNVKEWIRSSVLWNWWKRAFSDYTGTSNMAKLGEVKMIWLILHQHPPNYWFGKISKSWRKLGAKMTGKQLKQLWLKAHLDAYIRH